MKNDAIAALFAHGFFVSPKALADLGLLDDVTDHKEPAHSPVLIADSAAHPKLAGVAGNCVAC